MLCNAYGWLISSIFVADFLETVFSLLCHADGWLRSSVFVAGFLVKLVSLLAPVPSRQPSYEQRLTIRAVGSFCCRVSSQIFLFFSVMLIYAGDRASSLQIFPHFKSATSSGALWLFFLSKLFFPLDREGKRFLSTAYTFFSRQQTYPPDDSFRCIESFSYIGHLNFAEASDPFVCHIWEDAVFINISARFGPW